MRNAPNCPVGLTNVAVSDALSEETLAFSAALLYDGEVIGHVSNDGHGGSHRFRFLKPEDARRFEAYVSQWAAVGGVAFEPADQLVSTLVDNFTVTPVADLISSADTIGSAADLSILENALVEYAELIRVAVRKHHASVWTSDLAECPLDAERLRVLATRWREYHLEPPQFADRVDLLADAIQLRRDGAL